MSLFSRIFGGNVKFTNKKGVWYLHTRTINLKTVNRQQRIYWFAKSLNKELAVREMPDDFKIMTTRTGMPLLKRV